MDHGFYAFQTRLKNLFEIKDNDDPQPCYEVLFDIVEGIDERYVFDFEHLRLSQNLLLAAVLLSEWKNKNVLFLTATNYYSTQAIRFVRNYREMGLTCSTLEIGVSGCLPTESFRKADVILHHGRVYPLPIEVKHHRTIIQIFPGENVPHDTRSLSTLRWATYTDD